MYFRIFYRGILHQLKFVLLEYYCGTAEKGKFEHETIEIGDIVSLIGDLRGKDREKWTLEVKVSNKSVMKVELKIDNPQDLRIGKTVKNNINEPIVGGKWYPCLCVAGNVSITMVENYDCFKNGVKN